MATLITGASSGIGTAFAEALAAAGHNLLLTGRAQPALEALAARLQAPGRKIWTVTADLALDGREQIRDYVARENLEIDLLINNAGLGSGGSFASLPLEREAEIVQTNIAAVVELTHWTLERMRRRGAGAIINVASTAGFQPVPFMTTYAASKAFVLNFSLGLWEENRSAGVHVMALCPGPTRTNFFARAGTRPRGGGMQTPEEVVKLALAGLRAKRPLVVCGWKNRLMIAVERVVPRSLVVRAAAKAMQAVGEGHTR